VRVLLSALACEPGKGSEPEVGFRAMLAAASRHDVWVLTASESIPALEEALSSDPRAHRIHLEGMPFGVGAERVVHLNAVGYHRRYDRWQRLASARALELDRQVGFDVVHHVTLASYWTRAGVANVGKPMVWGPIGGGVDPPLRLVPELGSRGVIEAAARVLGRPLIARLPQVRKTQRLATVILAQNPGTGRRLRGPGTMILLSNALAVQLDGAPAATPRTSELLFVGRLLPWKAPMLALRALRYVKHPDAVLRFCGDGPEDARLRRAARRWGLSGRIRFEGWMKRDRVLALLARAGALIHPSLHDEAPLCIAEALTLGTPVVCLDHGGPPEIVGQWPGRPSALVTPRGADPTARSIAAAVDRFLQRPPPTTDRLFAPRTSFEEELLWSYDQAVLRRQPSGSRPGGGLGKEAG
jgi:glycosyltransferase involved in cell wall biosynthesis